MKKLSILFGLTLCLFLTACGGPKVVTISSVGNEMKFDITQFEVKAGETVKLVLNNKATASVMKHNVVILTDKESINRVGLAAINAPNYLPEDPAIFIATTLVEPGQKTELTFTAPTEPGRYPYICTFPGHYALMQGVMIVK